MSTLRDDLKERLLSDSSVTDGMGNQVDDVDKQLVIENTFAEGQEEEDQKGDSIGLDVSQEKMEADLAPVKEANRDKESMIDDLGNIDTGITSQVQVHARSGKTEPGASVIALTRVTKKPKEDTMQNGDANKDVADSTSAKECVDPPMQNHLKDGQEDAKITEREQETVGSPPTYKKAADNIPSTSKITPEDVETAVKKVGGANELRLFACLMGKDEELRDPQGEYAFKCSYDCDESHGKYCSKYCGKYWDKSCGKCVMGYQFNKIKVASVKEGPTTAAIQWDDQKHPNVTLIFKVLMFLYYSIILLSDILTFLSTIYESTQKSQIFFDILSAFFSLVGTVVSFIALLVFFGRRWEETIRCWYRLLGCVKALCTTNRIRLMICCCKDCICCEKGTKENKDREKSTKENKDCEKSTEENKDCEKSTEVNKGTTDTLKDRMKGSRCYGCCSTQLQRLNRGKWATILGNFCEMFLTVLDENLSTVIIVLSLYTFIGRQQYRVFYIVTEWTEVRDIIKIIVAFLIFLANHIKRIGCIAINIHKFDKDIAKLKEKNSKLKRNCCQRLFGFQGRLVMHASLLSLLQIYCLFALAWKIIRDHCISEEEARNTAETTVIEGTVFNTTLPTVFEFGPLRGCSVPSLQPATVNGYTIYNIIYVTVLLPILSYLLLFVSNMPFFVEYSQLLHASGMYKFERAVDESKKEEAEKGVAPHHRLEILRIFFEVLNPNREFSKEDLMKKKEQLKEEREKIEYDIINGPYAAFREKIRAIITFFPTVILGVFHIALFALHISFLVCRYSPQFGVACLPTFDHFSVFTPFLPVDIAVIIFPAIILFFSTGFPGPFVTVMWIEILVGIIAIALMLMGSIVFVLALVCLVAMIRSSISPHNYTPQQL